jgi:hypothetical protein
MSLADRLLARLGGDPRTWRARALLRTGRLAFSRRIFGTSYAFQETSARARALPYMLRSTILPVAVALAVVVLMDVFNDDVIELAKDWHWAPISASTYDVLFEAVAGVTGVFLALYFTALSTVAATVYVNVPHDIRALIVRDRLGNVYVTGVAFTTALSVLLLIAHAVTGRAYELGPPVIGLFAAFSIFAFIRLGQRAFYLADPTLLANTLAYDFSSWFHRATDKGWRWEDPSFQEHFRRQAHKSVVSLGSLLAIGSAQPHLRGSSVRQLTTSIVALLVHYLGLRDRVPTTSRWFGERYEHKQWYLTDSTELETATSTSTALQPKAIPDVAWVEDALLGPLIDLVDADLDQEDYEGAYVVLGRFEPVWARLGERWSGMDVREWTRKLTDRVANRLATAGEPRMASRPALIPAIWDALAMLPMAAELGFHRNVTDRAVADLAQQLNSTDWDEKDAPYRLGVPRPVVGVLEKIQAGRRFEHAVDAEPTTRTPAWYVLELVFHAYEHAFQDQVNTLVALVTGWYPVTAKTLTEANMPDAAGAILSRGMEAAWKLERHIEHWQQIATELRAYEARPLRLDLVRPAWDWDSTSEAVREFRRELLRQLSASIPAHAARQRDPDIPDYLGEAVHRVGEAAFEALAENNDELFAQLFPTYFLGVLAIVSRIQGQVGDWQPSMASSAIAEPVIDAMDISGYALVFSELHGNSRLWETCTRPWGRYLQGDGADQRLRIIAAMHNYQRNLFAITHRAIGRTHWQMALNNILNALPREPTTHPFGNGWVRHDSALIRRIAPHDTFLGTTFHASDIFVVRFLSTLDGADGVDFGVADWVAKALTDAEDAEEPE